MTSALIDLEEWEREFLAAYALSVSRRWGLMIRTGFDVEGDRQKRDKYAALAKKLGHPATKNLSTSTES